ncbi:GNAT family N-acetyltransferase [Candidatus Eisenbacteria bacterium]|uniref:GNAT family N-acetyltransferase n=1 Tax=Eiseniibacteriota bacterium TaxID=2212470 RepID=A0ABV6YM54_UNCEI
MTQVRPRLVRPRLLTKRLILEPLRPRHVEELFTAIRESAPQLSKWLPFVDQTKRPEDLLGFIRHTSRGSGDAVWGVWEKTKDIRSKTKRTYCGTIGLHGISLDQGVATLGYWSRTSVSGQGYTTEAAAAALLWALDELGLERVAVSAGTGNTASLRVIDKLGFEREGLLRSAQKIPSRRRRLDWAAFGLVRKDLRKVRPKLHRLCGSVRPWE